MSPEEVKNLTGLGDGYNILRLDLERIRARLRRHARIKDARIRVAPLKGVVEIYVEERKPVGRVEDSGGRGYLVDAEGVILGAAAGENPALLGLSFLPETGRVPRWAAELLGFYRTFPRCSELFPRIDVSDLDSVVLYPPDGSRPIVKIGGVGGFTAVVPKLERLLRELDVSSFETIDCRLGDGCVLKPRVEGGRESG